MRLINKMLFGAAALAGATAASFPHGFGDIPFLDHSRAIREREALKLCQEQSRSFVSFLASDRSRCYHDMRGVGTTASYSGVWSKPDRQHMRMATD